MSSGCSAVMLACMLVYLGCLKSVEWDDGIDYWDGALEWNTGMDWDKIFVLTYS